MDSDFKREVDAMVAGCSYVEIRVLEINRARVFGIRGKTPLGWIYTADRKTRKEFGY